MAIVIYNSGNMLTTYPESGMPNTNSTITISCWIKYSLWATGTTASMLGLYDGNSSGGSTTTGVQIGSRTAGNVDIWTWGGIGLVSTNGLVTLPSNDWIHVVYTCTAISGGTQTHSVYINGVLINTSTNALQVANIVDQLFINGYPGSAGAESNTNIIDSIAVYDRILSAKEILTVYTLTGSRDNITNGLVCRYNFEEAYSGTITTCNDSSINNNHLTATGTGTSAIFTAGYATLNSRGPV